MTWRKKPERGREEGRGAEIKGKNQRREGEGERRKEDLDNTEGTEREREYIYMYYTCGDKNLKCTKHQAPLWWYLLL